MAQPKPSTDEELDAMFADIGKDDQAANTSKAAAAASASKPTNQPTDEEEDHFADLRTLAARPDSRSDTPRMSSSATSVRRATPPSTQSGRSSEEKLAGNADTPNQKILSAPPAPASQAQTQATAAGGSWWGSLTSIASAAVKGAEAAYKEVSKNEEAQRLAERVKGNYGALQGFSEELRTRFDLSTLIDTIAPPISQHERLQIHISHDLIGYPTLEPMIFQTFSRVMSQVEGGDLLVVQRGSEFQHRRVSEAGYTGSGSNGWNDGPWWRQADPSRSLGAVNGLAEGTKLARANAESYAKEFFAARGGMDEAAKSASAAITEENPVRSSDIFLAIQAINHTAPADLFAASTNTGAEPTEGDKAVGDEPEQPDELVSFAVYLHDPVHGITFTTLSQGLPQTWTNWLDAKSESSVHDGTQFVPSLPAEVQEVIAAGGVDPREWISEWLEETLMLSCGVVAQRYVARRMGVGEGGLGPGKRREEIVESNGGEAARAM